MQGGCRTTQARWPPSVGRLPKTHAALSFAKQAHVGQRRAVDGAPFIVHPLEVAKLLYRAGAPDHVIAAGILHDVLEKTGVGEAELRERFGWAIAKIVLAVTEDEGIVDYEQRKAGLRRRVGHAGQEALSVFAADKISKIRELHLGSERRSESPTVDQRLAHYESCQHLLEGRIGGSPLVQLLARELEQLVPSHDAPLLASSG